MKKTVNQNYCMMVVIYLIAINIQAINLCLLLWQQKFNFDKGNYIEHAGWQSQVSEEFFQIFSKKIHSPDDHRSRIFMLQQF